jgi:hypothetical protein
MTIGPIYCRYCEEQIASCLAAAHEQDEESAYFLSLAWRWARLARDLDNRHACGPACPLRKTCASTLPAIVEPAVDGAGKRPADQQRTQEPSAIPVA